MTREQLSRYGLQGTQLALAVLLLVVPLVFYTQTYDVFETNKLAAFRILTLLGALGFLASWLARGRAELRPTPLAAPLAAVGVSSLLSTLVTHNRLTSVWGVYEDYEGILTIANYLLLWFLVNSSVRSLADARRYLSVVIVAGALAAGYGVAQNFGFDFVLWNPTTYSAARLFGSLGNPNFLAAYLLMALPVALMGFWLARGLKTRLSLLFVVLLMVVCIFFTKSRGAAYGLAAEIAGFAAYLLYDIRRAGGLWIANRKWMAVLGALAVLSLASPMVRSAVTTTVTRTLATLDVREIHITPRLYIWRSALQMIRDHPLLGTGLDTFQITFPQYRLAEYWELEWNGTPEKAHNFFLQIGATTGGLGLGAWLWLIGAFFALMLRRLRDLPPARRHLAAAVTVAQVGFLVQNQFNFTVVAYGSVFWFFLALGPALDRDEPSPARDGEPFAVEREPRSRSLLVLGGALLVAGLLVVSVREWTADVFFKRGVVFLSVGQPDRALPFFEQAVALNAQREIYWVKYGIAYEEAAKRAAEKPPLLERAVAIHQRTIAMNPLNGYDFNNLGRVYKYWGEYLQDPAKLTLAEDACREASRLDPYNVYFALDLASVYLAQKRYDEARAIAQRLTGQFPEFAIPYSYLGYVALIRGDTATALSQFEIAAARNWRGDVNTQASTYSNLGIVRADRAELDGAAQAFRRALELQPQYLEARMNLAVVYERQGRAAEALQEYERLLASAPDYPRADAVRLKIAQLTKAVGARP